jgi:PhoH-like ATPase
MTKIFVLDTNVLLHDPHAILQFADNDVVLPITVIEELDRFKKLPEMTGRNARQVSRNLDAIAKQGHLTEGIKLDNGGSLRVVLCQRDTLRSLPAELEGDTGDNTILAVALDLRNQCQCRVILVSKDTNIRIKANALGLETMDYETSKVDVEDLYAGTDEVMVAPDVINQIYKLGALPISLLEDQGKQDFYPNQALTLIDRTNPQHTALAIYDGTNHKLKVLSKASSGDISRIRARNREQKFALELLLDPEISLVTLVGQAGTGKTLLAIAAGLTQVADSHLYTRLLISRPVIPMGKDIGFLPGDIKEKLTPWMQPLYDNFDLIFGTQEQTGKASHWRRGHEELIQRGLLQIEPLTYIRGRTIPKQFFIVDEAQNLTPHEVKTILTRAGEDTKIVLTGDINQIDHPYIDAASNGLTYVIERFKDDAIAGHITLIQGERSKLAERAVSLLN